MLTVITEMFGVRGQVGDMILEPKLLKEQFDEEKKASLTLLFADKNWKITYLNHFDQMCLIARKFLNHILRKNCIMLFWHKIYLLSVHRYICKLVYADGDHRDVRSKRSGR